jgi:WD40 repeat protein
MPPENIKYHSILSLYFYSFPHFIDGDHQKMPHIRKCVELPFQQTKAQLWDEVTDTLCNLDFIQAKACAKKTYDLVKDFIDVLEVIPDNAENILNEKLRQDRMDKYTSDLIACSKGELARNELEIPESITPWSNEEIEAEMERLKYNPTRLDKIKSFHNFLGKEAANLQNCASEIPNFIHQQAWNSNADGPISYAAENAPLEYLRFSLLRIKPLRQHWFPLPQILNIFPIKYEYFGSVRMLPDGSKAISGSGDGNAILWDLKTGEPMEILKGYGTDITAIDLTPDGKLAISGSREGTCVVWNLETGSSILTLKGHSEGVTCVAIAPNGKRAVSVSQDKTCILWDLTSGEVLNTFRGHPFPIHVISITPDGKRAVSGSDNKTCIFWDLTTGEVLQTLKGHSGSVTAVSITPDGQKAVSSSDATCIFWDLNTGKAQQILKGYDNDRSVLTIDITPDGKMAIAGSADRTCILWNLQTGMIFKKLIGHHSNINSISIAADGKRAFSSSTDRTCIFWNLETGGNIQANILPTDQAAGFSILPDGKKVISCFFGQPGILWNTTTGEVIQTMKGLNLMDDSLIYTTDRNRVFSKSWEHTFIEWNLTNGMVINYNLDIHPDRKSVKDKRTFRNMTTGDIIVTFKKKIREHQEIITTPEGKRAILVFRGKDIDNFILVDLSNSDIIQTYNCNSQFTAGSISCSPDGKLAIAVTRNYTCILWNLSASKPLKILKGHTGTIRKITFTPDGRRAISCSDDHTCIFWDLKTGESIHLLKGRHTSGINSLAVSHDGLRAISGSYDKTCVVWDLKSGKVLGCFISDFKVSFVTLFPHGIFFCGECYETTILNVNKNLLRPGAAIITICRIWDLELKKFLELSADCPLCQCRFAPPASIVATIENITKNAGLRPDQSPCLELPDAAWEDPDLLGNCPKCGEKLKFNPFIAGGDY